MSQQVFIPGIKRVTEPKLVMPPVFVSGEAGSGKTEVIRAGTKQAIERGLVKAEEILVVANDVWGTAFGGSAKSLGIDAVRFEAGIEVDSIDTGCACCEDTREINRRIEVGIEKGKRLVLIESAPGGDPVAPINAVDNNFDLRSTSLGTFNLQSSHPDFQYMDQVAASADIALATRGSERKYLEFQSKIQELLGDQHKEVEIYHSPQVGEFRGNSPLLDSLLRKRGAREALTSSSGHKQRLFRCNLEIPENLVVKISNSSSSEDSIFVVDTATNEEFPFSEAVRSLPRAKALMYDDEGYPFALDYVRDDSGPRVTAQPLSAPWSIAGGNQVASLMSYSGEFAPAQTVKLGTPALDITLFNQPAYQYPDPAAVFRAKGFVPSSHRADSLFLTAKGFLSGYPNPTNQEFVTRFSRIVGEYAKFRVKALQVALEGKDLQPEARERAVLETTFDLMNLLVAHGAGQGTGKWYNSLLTTSQHQSLHKTLTLSRQEGGLGVPHEFFSALATAQKLPLTLLDLPFKKLSPEAKDFSLQDPGVHSFATFSVAALHFKVDPKVIRTGLNGLYAAMQREGKQDFLDRWPVLNSFAKKKLGEL